MNFRNEKTKGFSLVEAILAGALFSLIVGPLVGAIIYGRETTAVSGERVRAVFFAEEGLEAVRNIKSDGFGNLIDGTYGLDNSSNQWEFSGSEDTKDIFTRQIEIATVDENTKNITSNVFWEQNGQRSGNVSLVTQLTKWKRTFRVIEYFLDIGSFSGINYSLTLDQDLENNYFVIAQGSDGDGSSNGNRGPDENYISLVADPNGTGDLGSSGASNTLSFYRRHAADSWVGVITVVECLGDCSNSGFRLLDVQRSNHPNTVGAGTDTSGMAWSDIDQVVLMGGVNGSGCDTDENSQSQNKVCTSRIWPSGNDVINWDRGLASDDATSTIMVVEWGSEWNIQRVNATGSAGGNGANSASEYNTASINSVPRDNTWVWGTGYTDTAGIGEGAEGVLITLGDGANQSSDESSVAIGQEYPRDKNFEVYALTHSDMNVDYRFKNDGDSGNLTVDVSMDSAVNSRMALVTNGCNGTGTAYPRPNFSARYISDNTIRLERRRSGQAFPAWVQGIDFSGISH